MPRYHRMYSELNAFVIRELASTVSMKSVASRCNISATTVARLMGYLAVGQRRLPEVLSIVTEWYMHVASCDLPEFNRCMETIVAWQDEVLNSFKVRYTNEYTEGVNNKIKVLRRVAYGVKNFVRFRQRILHEDVSIERSQSKCILQGANRRLSSWSD